MPHLTRSCNSFHGSGQLALLSIGGFGGKDSGSEFKPHFLQKGTLVHERQDRGASPSNGISKRLEVDVSGKIALARPVEDWNFPVAAHGLKGIAQGRCCVAIVDDDRRRAVKGKAPAKRFPQTVGSRPDLGDIARRGGRGPSRQ